MKRIAAAPVEEGIVAALTHDGEGIVRAGKTAFVDGALPQEEIRFRRLRAHRAHDEAELVEVLQPSADRVAPGCASFGVCGGCALQHLDPAAQLASKERELRDTFARVAGLEPREWLPALPGPAWGYRRRARLGVKYVVKKGRVVVGFRERASPFVALIERCPVLAPPMDELIAPLAAMLGGLQARAAIPQIEVAVGDDATALVLRVLEPLCAADRDRLTAFEAEHGVRLFLQPGGLQSIEPLSPGTPPLLRYDLPEWHLRLSFRPTDFVQVNSHVNRALIARALELLQPDACSSVLDLFCGLGNFTLPLARVAGSVVGVEGDAGLVERAAANARANGIENAAFVAADLAGAFGAELARGARPAGMPPLPATFTHVLLDPPRTGARELLAGIAALAPRRVVYVSCHPASLARDVGVLCAEHGFQLRAAGAIDMFPHTAHVESIAVLEPRRT